MYFSVCRTAYYKTWRKKNQKSTPGRLTMTGGRQKSAVIEI